MVCTLFLAVLLFAATLAHEPSFFLQVRKVTADSPRLVPWQPWQT